MPNENAMKNKIGVVVTTAHRGVFFGFIPKLTDDKTIRLESARMCVYWSADMKGIVGLASQGPSKTCKIGPTAPAVTLQDVTSVMECSPEAIEAWTTIIWK